MGDNITMPIQDVIQEFSHMERQFREKLYELQNNKDALQAIQKEFLEIRHALYSTELLLEKERGISQELRMQLKTAMDMMNELQQQQMQNQVESIQLQVKYDAISKQYDSLMNEVTSVKVQETEYKMKIQSLEEILQQKDTTNKRLEQALKDVECNSMSTINAINLNITKLKQEQEYLTKSCEAIINLNQRLQIVGLCTHAIHQNDKMKIKNLECMLASISVKDVESANYNVHTDKKESQTI